MKAADSKKRAGTKRASLAKAVDKNKKIKVRVSHSANRLALVNRALKKGHKALIPLEHQSQVKHIRVLSRDEFLPLRTIHLGDFNYFGHYRSKSPC